jgi:hypothetical protein
MRRIGIAALLSAVVLIGCARAPRAPVRSGEPCERDADCLGFDAGAEACVPRRLCVAGRCERDAGSLLVCD